MTKGKKYLENFIQLKKQNRNPSIKIILYRNFYDNKPEIKFIKKLNIKILKN